GGVEYAFTNNWTARLEYLYYDFGSETVSNVSTVAPPLAYNTTFSTKVNVVRAGVNYKF
ncbi:MAG TPA: outer membrane beta-barrel protein, partial [Afipia sp.]